MISEQHRRSILQFLLFERMMSYSDFTDTVCRVVGTDDVRTDSLVESLNEKIRRFSQKIVIANSESTGEKLVVLASTADSAEIKSSLSKDQMDFFYHLMDFIISSMGYITYINALNSAPLHTSGRITISEGEKVLESFVKKKLLIHEHGCLFLSPLAIIEMGPYIMENYAPQNCILCKKMRIAGGGCPHCEAAIHNPCFQQYILSSKGKARCPQCKGDWSVQRGEP